LVKTKTASPRCQIALTFDVARPIPDGMLIDLVTSSSVAALIFYSQEGDDMHLQQRVSALIRPIQAQEIAVLVAGDPRIAVRVGVDGIHSEEPFPLSDMGKNMSSMMLGYGNIKDRHQAMEMGEAQADYIMFGKLGADKNQQPHPRNLRLGAWWAAMMEIPCLIQAGGDIESIRSVLETGGEFVAIEEMIFAAKEPFAALAQVNQLLDNDFLLRQETHGI